MRKLKPIRTVIISAHTDDAIFSLGDFIQALEDVTILSVFSGIPPISLDNGVGYKKHTLLREEHRRACELMGVKYVNMNFLDDVYYPRPTSRDLVESLTFQLYKYDHIIAPIGIHHPDHILLREVLSEYYKPHKWYKDLPYANLYPQEKEEIVSQFNFKTTIKVFSAGEKKQKAIECYASQIQNDHIMNELLTTEEIYEW